jgi:4-hydroxybenzoyl-CoA reductase subunit beta
MMRLPRFAYDAPQTVAEAAERLAAAPPGEAMLIAGGTDLLPNMKRRQQAPATLISLGRIQELKGISTTASDHTLTIGAATTLAELTRTPAVRAACRGLWQAAAQVATPHLRNMGTLGGNLCLDTRCSYYDQNYEWRKAIDFCMKKDGSVCWVAPSSSKCLAVSSTDTAPMLVALGATVRLVSSGGARDIELASLYGTDGINYLTRRPDEILTTVRVHVPAAARSAYWKLRRRGSFDFPVLSVAVALTFREDETVDAARIVLGAVASRPIVAAEAAASLVGRRLTDTAIADASALAAVPARPMDNTDFSLVWRKRVAREFVSYALREVRGEDVSGLRARVAHNPLLAG